MAEMSKSCCALSPVCGGVMGCWSAGGPFGVGAPLGSIIITTPSPVVPGLPPPWGGLKGPLWSMSLDGNESVILWCRGSVVLVPIPQLPSNPACSAAQPPLPPSPPLQLTPQTYSDVSKSLFALQNRSEVGGKRNNRQSRR